MNPATQAHYEKREGVLAHWMLWIEARRKADGVTVGLGFWQGDDHQDLFVEGENRTYFGAQSNLDFGVINYSNGLDIQSHTVAMSGVNPEVEILARNYDFRFVPAEVHVAHIDPATGLALGIDRHFKGYVNGAPYVTAQNRGSITMSVQLVSTVRDLTFTPNLMKSHASQELLSGDTFREFATMADISDDPWGSK